MKINRLLKTVSLHVIYCDREMRDNIQKWHRQRKRASHIHFHIKTQFETIFFFSFAFSLSVYFIIFFFCIFVLLFLVVDDVTSDVWNFWVKTKHSWTLNKKTNTRYWDTRKKHNELNQKQRVEKKKKNTSRNIHETRFFFMQTVYATQTWIMIARSFIHKNKLDKL